MAISAEGMMNMTQQQAQLEIEEEITTVSTQALLLMNKINESRRKGIELSNPQVERINRNTVRAENGFVTKKFQFKDRKGKFVKKGKPYHVHYTKDLSVYHMTSFQHDVFSELIYPVDVNNNLIGYYNTLNKQEPILLESNIAPPTEDDYKAGFMIRSFARKANDERKVPFEINSDDMLSSPLYEYISVTWYLTGTPESVEAANRRRIELASEDWPNIKGLLSPFQYFRKLVNQTPEEIIRERLGESPTQTQTQNQSTGGKAKGKGNAPVKQTSNQNYGAGAGTTTGGGGGGSSSY